MSAVTSSSVGPSKKKPGACGKFRFSREKLEFAALVLFFSAVSAFSQSSDSILPGPKPAGAPATWKAWIGDYGADNFIYTAAESGGHIQISSSRGGTWTLDTLPLEKWATGLSSDHPQLSLKFERDAIGVQVLVAGEVAFSRRKYGSDGDHITPITSIHAVAELRRDALAAKPPAESGPFRAPDLVDLAPLDPSIHLDIRYATTNDFLGTPVYTQARAFLQRPAAEALLRVLQKLKPLGYGLLIHDGYRPWYVTKIFWDATPPEGKIFVADPAQGSRHNRGCAVDLTLYDLKTGQPVEMTGGYDEMSPRSFPNYPGGTSLQRWHRDLLRRAMESEGFTVYDSEWWHFDYKDWHEYGILNVPFEKLGIGSPVK
jgi:D-alanyl-D-alanine dipeptidase